MESVDHPQDCIFHLLSKASRAATRYWKNEVSDLGITAVQAKVINQLGYSGPLLAGELSKLTTLDTATLSGILDRLESLSLIARVSSDEDRRAIRITLTAEGQALASTIQERLPKANQDFLAGLSSAENAMLRELLKRL